VILTELHDTKVSSEVYRLTRNVQHALKKSNFRLENEPEYQSYSQYDTKKKYKGP